MNALRIMIADDHQVVRLGVRSLLASHEGWEVCGEAVDGREAVEKCKLLKPDLLILDICMPALNGMDAARQILKANPNQRILIFTDVDSEQVIRECLEMGVRGWLWKSDQTSHLCLAVESLQNGRTFFTARVAELILNSYLQSSTTRPAETIVVGLSPREREVLQLLSEGNTTKKIASMLNVTVENGRNATAPISCANLGYIRSPSWCCTRCETISYKFTLQFLRLQLTNLTSSPSSSFACS
jgi:DNA-binding NarL/FixJ family response regulator